jgi:L-asparaginase
VRALVVVTGGTFDKEYDELRGTLSFRKTHLPEMLDLGRCRLETRVQELMMKDSLNMTARDRASILAACRRAPENRIVITHGTDTMPQTARALGLAGLPGKTVVLTGAMRPYRFGSSDGLFNLGSALSFAQALTPGVYVAMNGLVFSWDDVKKDKRLGIFTRLGGQKTQAPRRA